MRICFVLVAALIVFAAFCLAPSTTTVIDVPVVGPVEIPPVIETAEAASTKTFYYTCNCNATCCSECGIASSPCAGEDCPDPECYIQVDTAAGRLVAVQIRMPYPAQQWCPSSTYMFASTGNVACVNPDCDSENGTWKAYEARIVTITTGVGGDLGTYGVTALSVMTKWERDQLNEWMDGHNCPDPKFDLTNSVPICNHGGCGGPGKCKVTTNSGQTAMVTKINYN